MAQTILNNGDTGLVARGAINDNFTEVYRRGSINVAEYGAVGDGETDDTTALQNAFNAANIANKNVEFEENKTYSISTTGLSFYGKILDGRGSTIKNVQDGASASHVIKCEGSLGSNYAIDSDALAVDRFIEISNATYLNAVSEGDMGLITTSALFENGKDEDSYQGETFEIVKVHADKIEISQKLNDTYLTSDTAVLHVVNYIDRPVIRNLTIIQNEEKDPEGDDGSLYGIELEYCKRPVVENVSIMYAKNYAVDIIGCYEAMIDNLHTQMNTKAGAGYGVSISGANTNPTVRNSIIKGARHAVAHNGSAGVAHNSRIENVVGEGIRQKPIFDAHGGCGRVTFIGCTAIGGIPLEEDRDNIKGEWASGTEYSTGDIVTKDNILWECLVASSTGNDPTTHDDWTYYNNLMSGFVWRSSQMNFINCTVINCSDGFSADDWSNPSYEIYANNIKMYNVIRGLSLTGGAEYTNTQIDNFYISNKYYKKDCYAIYADDVSFAGIQVGRVVADNIRGVYMNDVTGETVHFESLECSDIAIFDNTGNTDLILKFGSIFINSVNGTVEYNIFIRSLSEVWIDNLRFVGDSNYVVYVLGNMDILNIGKVDVVGGDNLDYFLLVSLTFTITTLFIGSAHVESGTDIDFVRCRGAITKAHIGALSGDIDEDFRGADNRPGLEVINGDFDKPVLSRGAGTPESNITALIGSMYLRTDGGENTTLYVKESGTGNTGWAAI